MTQLLALGSCPFAMTDSRTRRLLGAPKGYNLVYAEPGTVRGGRHQYNKTQPGDHISLLTPDGKTLPWNAKGILSAFRLRRQAGGIALAQNSGSMVRGIWCETVIRRDVLAQIPHQKMVFDCRDTDGFSEKQLLDMASRADAVTVAKAADAEILRSVQEKLCYLPDGADFDLFSQSSDPLLPFPPDLFHIREPILGHIGTPGDQGEMGYVEAAAAANPSWNFVFLGNAPKPPSCKNIHFLGEKNPKLWPLYLGHFNLCFRIESSDASLDLPISLFACFSAGKPLVTTLYPKRVLDFTEVVYFAHSAEAFMESCRRALAERDAWRKKERIAFARAGSWDARAAQLDAFLREKDII